MADNPWSLWTTPSWEEDLLASSSQSTSAEILLCMYCCLRLVPMPVQTSQKQVRDLPRSKFLCLLNYDCNWLANKWFSSSCNVSADLRMDVALQFCA